MERTGAYWQLAGDRLGDALREMREATGRTQKEIAQHACLDPSMVSRFESGDKWDEQLASIGRMFSAFGYRLTVEKVDA